MHPTKRTILLVDDDAEFRHTLAERLELKGFTVMEAAGGGEAVAAAKQTKPDCAVVDMHMPDMDGLVTIAKLKESYPDLQTVLLTAHGNDKLQQATEGLDAAYYRKENMGDFWSFLNQLQAGSGNMIIIAPQGGVTSTEQLEMLAARQMVESEHAQEMFGRGPGAVQLIGQTPGMQKLKSDIAKVATLDCTVLILGETGTGKELVARSIHTQSPRAKSRFLAVNCSTFSPELLSNELFGHERDAFTGARHLKKGVFEAVAGGTILLDEIGDTPLAMQVQLLRVLQEKTIIRVGGTEELPVDVRVVAATNQSLKGMIADGEFREDLYYRLNVFTLRIPPLRERREDIPTLCSYFMNKYNMLFGKQVKRFDTESLSLLMGYSFPGNVRELESIVERVVVLCEDDTADRRHLPSRFEDVQAYSDEVEGGPLLSLAQVEEAHILKVLAAVEGNRNEAAKALGISRAGLWRKLKKMEAEGKYPN